MKSQHTGAQPMSTSVTVLDIDWADEDYQTVRRTDTGDILPIDQLGGCDWKQSPGDSFLESLNGLLKQHGLEILILNDESDEMWFTVQPNQS